VKKVSTKRRKALSEYSRVRNAYLAALAGKDGKIACKRCVRSIPVKAITVHHMRGRIGSLLCDTRHWTLLCMSCHNWVGDHPTEARDAGLLCEKGLWNTPDRTHANLDAAGPGEV
jgi:hypothetical protein